MTRRCAFVLMTALFVAASCSSAANVEPETIRSGTIYGDWVVAEINGDRASGGSVEMSVFIGLEPAFENSFTEPGALMIGGHDGCNGFGGGYFREGTRIRTGPLAQTLIGCADDKGHSELIKEILRSSVWSVERDRLTLVTDTGDTAILHRRQGSQLIGPWRLVDIDGTSVDVEAILTLHQSGYSGYSGCWVTGESTITESRVAFGAAASIMAATTTVVADSGEPSMSEPVSALFDCPSPDDPSGQVVHELDGAEGELNGSVFTIAVESGSIMTFELP